MEANTLAYHIGKIFFPNGVWGAIATKRVFISVAMYAWCGGQKRKENLTFLDFSFQKKSIVENTNIT